MSKNPQHRIVWTDRNREDADRWGKPLEEVRHVHRWKPSCSCGTWVGIPRRTKGRCREDFDRHVDERNRATARTRHPDRFEHPRDLTPRKDLPEALR